MPKTAKALADEMESIWDTAERENRGLTADERQYMEGLVDEATSQNELEKKMRELGGAGPSFVTRTDPNWSNMGGGPGDVFVKSQGYQRISDAASRPQTWSSGPVEVATVPLSKSFTVLTKGTMLETTAGGPGGGMGPPLYEPGVVSRLFEPLGVADVFGQSTTNASQVRYVNEGTATSGAAGVAEAGVKPESTIAMSEVSEPVKKIATTLPISDEFLEDAPSIQSYLNERLTLFINIEEERQLLRGNGTNELIGLFNRSGAQAINTYSKLAADDNTTALARVIANTRGSSFLQPDAVIIHPTNWLNMRLLRDGSGGTVGNYLAGGPFGVSSNNAGGAALSARRCGTRESCCPRLSGSAPRSSATSDSAPTSGGAEACPSRRQTATATGSSRTFRCSGPRNG